MILLTSYIMILLPKQKRVAYYIMYTELKIIIMDIKDKLKVGSLTMIFCKQ